MWSTTGGHYDRDTCKMADQELQKKLFAIGGKEYSPRENTKNPVQGDVNKDGEFNVADVVLLQKWILAAPDTTLADWKTADLCEDNRLDIFDLCMMKQILRQQITIT